MSSATLQLHATIDLVRYDDLPAWPTHLTTPEHIDYDIDAGTLSVSIWFDVGSHFRVLPDGDGIDAQGPYLETLRTSDLDAYYDVLEWAKATYRLVDDMVDYVRVEASFAPGVHDAITALATGKPAPTQVPTIALDEDGILAEAALINAIRAESPIRFLDGEDGTILEGTVRTGRWSVDGQPARGDCVQTSQVRITLRTGRDVFRPFADLVRKHRAGGAAFTR